ncbi:MAG TPA: hypothetical protein DEG69_00880 [Flavobacteriaceae bacterium]|nr:hypothetical protein [Flavobacteriaceae bacterium]
MNDVNSGEQVTKEMVLNKATEIYDGIVADLNKLTNDRKNCRNIFDNPYYINDIGEDKRIAKEIERNKLNIEKAKQNGKNNKKKPYFLYIYYGIL